jgi:hypothetical protein
LSYAKYGHLYEKAKYEKPTLIFQILATSTTCVPVDSNESGSHRQWILSSSNTDVLDNGEFEGATEEFIKVEEEASDEAMVSVMKGNLLIDLWPL